MDRDPDPTDVPDEIISHFKAEDKWDLLCARWDEKYPANPVHEPEEEDGE